MFKINFFAEIDLIKNFKKKMGQSLSTIEICNILQ